MSKYHCNFPNCSYSTEIRTQIHKHHIIPREENGSDKEWNLIFLCPNHHSKIFVPSAKKGIHSKKSKDSIILLNKYKSTQGSILEYQECSTNTIKLVEINM